MISDVEHLFMCFGHLYVLWRNVYARPVPIIELGFLLLSSLSYRSSVYILDINPLSDVVLQIFSLILWVAF